MLLQRRRGINGERGGPFFVDVHITDAEAVMEDADTKVEMPVDLLPTPRVEDEVVAEKDAEDGDQSFEGRLKMLDTVELDVKDMTFGGGKKRAGGGGGAELGGGIGGRGRTGFNGKESGPFSATIRDLERKGDGNNKSFKFTVDLDFVGNKTKSLTLKKRGSSGTTT